jgi:hypothetical protein
MARLGEHDNDIGAAFELDVFIRSQAIFVMIALVKFSGSMAISDTLELPATFRSAVAVAWMVVFPLSWLVLMQKGSCLVIGFHVVLVIEDV